MVTAAGFVRAEREVAPIAKTMEVQVSVNVAAQARAQARARARAQALVLPVLIVRKQKASDMMAA